MAEQEQPPLFLVHPLHMLAAVVAVLMRAAQVELEVLGAEQTEQQAIQAPQATLLRILAEAAAAVVMIPLALVVERAAPALSFSRSTSHENLSTHGH